MGETMTEENAPFWLPTHFLTDDDDFLPSGDDDHSFKKDSSLFSDGFVSEPFGPPETETERGDNDVDEFISELTRQLSQSTLRETYKEPWVFSTSPQSILTGFGTGSNRSGFSGSSPNLTPPARRPENDAAWEVLYEAAGKMARLKMAAQMNHHHQQLNRGVLRAPKSHHINGFYDFPHNNQEAKRQGRPGWAQGMQEREDLYCHHHHHHHHHHQKRLMSGGSLGLPPSACSHHHHRHHDHHQQSSGGGGPGMRAVFLGGSGSGPGPGLGPGLKRQSIGTGVFLPRRFGTQPEPRKKPTGCSTVLLPTRVVQALSLDLEDNNGVNLKTQPRFGAGFVTEHDILMARRNNTVLNQQRRSLIRTEQAATMAGHDIRLPSDWTY